MVVRAQRIHRLRPINSDVSGISPPLIYYFFHISCYYPPFNSRPLSLPDGGVTETGETLKLEGFFHLWRRAKRVPSVVSENARLF